MEEMFNQIMTLLGGITVVLAALFGFIGKIWLSRIIEKEKNKLQTKILKIQNDLSVTNRKLEAELQRSVHVDKTQFDHEFKIYKEVWAALVDLRTATQRLRPTLDYVDPKQPKEELMRERIAAFAEPFNGYLDIIEKNKPFYSEKVYEALYEILKQCHGERVDYEYTERNQAEYFQEARANHEKMVQAIDEACEKIRERINEVKIIS
jgi:hypothetical protein